MKKKESPSLFASIPGVDSLLEHPAATDLLKIYARSFVIESIRECLDELRETIRNDEARAHSLDLSPEGILNMVNDHITDTLQPHFKRVINATGILLHTNIGRALLADEAVEAMTLAGRAACNLELDLESGKRGHRDDHLEGLLCRLTGAEAATVVNNNAAAVMLCLNTVAEGKDVIISRGQLVEIGGSFRLPDVVAKSGARLVEVGTTNRTYLKDYEKHCSGETGALLYCHPSNFIVVGFTADVPIEDLVALGKERGVPVVYDLGSGALVDLSQYGLEREPLVRESVECGIDLVTFSGDKLLGGPQAGIIVGKKAYVESVKQNPLKRALRLDKCTIAALEATLRIYLSEPDLPSRLPIFGFLTRSIEEISQGADRIVKSVESDLSGKVDISLQNGHSRVGGGSMPMESLPTRLIALKPVAVSPDVLASRLRNAPVPIIARIQQDTVLLDLRTVRAEEEEELIRILHTLNYE